MSPKGRTIFEVSASLSEVPAIAVETVENLVQLNAKINKQRQERVERRAKEDIGPDYPRRCMGEYCADAVFVDLPAVPQNGGRFIVALCRFLGPDFNLFYDEALAWFWCDKRVFFSQKFISIPYDYCTE